MGPPIGQQPVRTVDRRLDLLLQVVSLRVLRRESDHGIVSDDIEELVNDDVPQIADVCKTRLFYCEPLLDGRDKARGL